MEEETLTYDQLIAVASPLDLLLFKGGDLFSTTIRFIEELTTGYGDYSHVGIIVTKDILPNVGGLEDGKLYVWESTMSHSLGGMTDGVPNVETGKGRLGAQIRDFKEVLKSYTQSEGTEVAWCKLIDNPWNPIDENLSLLAKRRKKLAKVMMKCHRDYGNKVYELNVLSLLASVIPCLRPARDTVEWDEDEEDQDFVFCSELVALIYRRLGVLGKEFDPSNVVPVDFLGCDADGMPKLVEDPITLLSDEGK